MTSNPRNVDDYLANLPGDKRAALEELRRIIRDTVPEAEERISYGLPAFRFQGRMLVGYGATAKHCAFYPMSSTTVAAFQADLKDFSTSKGTIRFQAEDPLPADLVRRIVKARIAENAAK